MLKLRARCDGLTVPFAISEHSSYAELMAMTKEVLAADQGLKSGIKEFHLSLNRRDPIACDETATLKEIGLASGDLVHVLRIGDEPPATPNPDSKRFRAEGTPTLQAQPAALPEKSVTTEIHYARGMVWESTVTYTGPGPEREMERGAGAQDLAPVQGIRPEQAEETVRVMEGTDCMSVDETGGEHGGQGQAVSTAVVVESATTAGTVLIGQTDDIPAHLTDLLASSGATTSAEALFVCIYALMLESGFYPVSEEGQGVRHDSLHMPPGWNAPQHMSVEYGQTITQTPVVTELKCITMGGTLCVYAMLAGGPTVWSVQLQISKYVLMSGKSAGSGWTLTNLRLLSREFKNAISHRIVASLREMAGIRDLTTLSGLLPELKLLVMGHLSAKSLCRLAQVDRQFSALASDPLLWKRLFLRVFGEPPIPGGGNATLRGYDWKGEYIKRAKVEKQRRRMVFMMPAAPYIPPFPGFPGNMGPMGPPFPGILGGDYDRLPPPPFMGNPYAPSAGMGDGISGLVPRPHIDPAGIGGLGDPDIGPGPPGIPGLGQPRPNLGLGRGGGAGRLGGLGGGGRFFM